MQILMERYNAPHSCGGKLICITELLLGEYYGFADTEHYYS